jgi:transcriptional regulator with XRE-family HTH domain
VSTLTATENRVGGLLRDWRQRRRLSQMDLALEAGISTRHLSFVETGRSRPSPEMVVNLAEQLEVPLRERNQLLLAAGYAPRYEARSFDDPALSEVRDAVSRVLEAHEPYPAIAVDRHWNLIASNEALGPMLEGVAPELLVPLGGRDQYGDGPELTFFSTITTFGTAVDVTVSELAVEAFFPADPETAARLRG